jgi:hypothetical protein
MSIRFKVLESFNKIKGNITKELADLSSRLFRSKSSKVSDYLRATVYEAVYNCTEMESVRSGQLKADFGLNFDPTAEIAGAVSSAVEIAVVNQNSATGYSINIQPLTYLNLLEIPSAVLITEKGDNLPWLEWLTTYGDSVIIYNYNVRYESGIGRSNMGIMVKSPSFFRVDGAYSGTYDDNFVTRAITSPLFVASIQDGISRILR